MSIKRITNGRQGKQFDHSAKEKKKMANQISTETRNRKSEPYTEDGAIERWVNELAEVTGKSKEEIVDLALVKLSKEK